MKELNKAQPQTNAVFHKGRSKFAAVRSAGSFARWIQTQLRKPTGR